MKNSTKKLLIISSLLLLAPSISSCNLVDKIKSWFNKDPIVDPDNNNNDEKNEDNNVTPSITISGENSVVVGNTLTLTANVVNSNANVIWSSSNVSIATVDSNGVVTPSSTVTSLSTVVITASLENDSTIKDEFTISVYPASETKPSESNYTLSLSTSTLNIGTYDKNFTYNTTCISTVENIGFEIYRVKKSNNKIVILPINERYLNEYELEGKVYNKSSINDIESITITYSYQTTNGKENPSKPHLKFGTTKACDEMNYVLNDSSSTLTLDLHNYSFKYLEILSGDYSLEVSSCEIGYSSSSTSNPSYQEKSGENLVRFNPTTFEDDLVPGESSVDVPVDYTYNSNTQKYEVTKTKKYTYYTLDYVKSNSSAKNDASLTNPVDVCNYYTAFKTWPANYGLSSDKTAISNVFGSDYRQVSTYSRANGYALYVPYRNYLQTGLPLYHELDVDLESSYPNPRGVGRIVVWEAGFDVDGYDTNPVCVYTDDHYASFIEYYNNGKFSRRFNATGNPVNILYSAPTTIVPIKSTSTDDDDILEKSISITGNKELDSNKTLQLSVKYQNCNGNVVWSSSDENIATVSSNGLITPSSSINKNTEVTITAALESELTIKSSVVVSIKYIAPTTSNHAYRLVTSSEDLAVGSKYVLCYVPNENGQILTNDFNHTNVTLSGDNNEYIDELPANALQLYLGQSENCYTFTNSLDSSELLSVNGKNIGFNLDSSTNLFDIHFSSDGYSYIRKHNDSTGSILYNDSANIFRYYTSSQKAIRLYKCN